jgi:hypothetical protein
MSYHFEQAFYVGTTITVCKNTRADEDHRAWVSDDGVLDGGDTSPTAVELGPRPGGAAVPHAERLLPPRGRGGRDIPLRDAGGPHWVDLMADPCNPQRLVWVMGWLDPRNPSLNPELCYKQMSYCCERPSCVGERSCTSLQLHRPTKTMSFCTLTRLSNTSPKEPEWVFSFLLSINKLNFFTHFRRESAQNIDTTPAYATAPTLTR